MSHVPVTTNGHVVPFNLLVKLRAYTPPGAKLVEAEMLAADRVRMAYRYHGLTRVNRIEVAL